MKTKVCSTCGEEKILGEFYKNIRNLDGYFGYCKKCYTDKKNKNRASKGLPSMAIRHPCKVEKVCKSDEKQCSQCRKVKPLDDFSKLKSSKDGRSHQCKKCCKEIRDRTSNTVIRKHSNNMACVKHHYNITEDDLQGMLWRQQGCCAICEADFGTELVKNKGRQYHIDHSHDTGKVRGLICSACNTYIGAIEARKALNCPSNIKEYISRGL